MLNSRTSSTSATQLPQIASSAENLLSRLLMGFVERNVAAQTIVDVLKAQVMDAGHTAQSLSTPTTNGLVEVLTATSNLPGIADFLIFLAARPGFPQFLSPKAAFGMVSQALRILPGLHERSEILKFQKIVLLLDASIRRILSPDVAPLIGVQEKARIVNALKMMPDELKCRMASTMPSIEALKRLCVGELVQPLTPANPKISMPAATPQDLLKSILEMPEHTLAQKGVAQFRPMGSEDAIQWKTSNLHTVLLELENPQLSPFRRGFLTEWFFDGLLREILHAESFTATFDMLIKTVVETRGEDESVLKGVLRALQRDLSLTAIELNYPESRNAQFVKLLNKAGMFHVAALNAAGKNIGQFARQFASWALQMPVHPEESRLFTRNTWQWIRVITTKQWEDDLKEPPQWVSQLSSRFAALIFNLAPNFWLQDHAHILVERLHLESIQPAFAAVQQHSDYVEYLCRTLRKKSPAFAARAEIQLALRFIGRATAHEESQLNILETRYRMLANANDRSLLDPERQFWVGVFKTDASIDRFGSTPLTRALHVLLYTARLASKSQGRFIKS